MRKFSVIGRYDLRSEYFDKLSRICGLMIESSGHYNKTPDSEERGNVRTDKRLLAKLRDLLNDDIRFFEHYTR